MSAKLMGQVWGLQLSHSQQSVLLALADHAHDDGRTHPGVGYLAWKTNYSERQVIRIVETLRENHLLTITESSRHHRTTRYEIHLENGTPKPPYQRRHIVTSESGSGVTFETSGVTSEPFRHDIAMSPSTSVEPSSSTSLSADADCLLLYWRDTYHKTSQLTPGRKAKILARLKRFTPADLRLVIDLACTDDWRTGDNDRKRDYSFPESFLRNDDITDQLLAQARKPKLDITDFDGGYP